VTTPNEKKCKLARTLVITVARPRLFRTHESMTTARWMYESLALWNAHKRARQPRVGLMSRFYRDSLAILM